jgi:multiple sugar transport system ATP-binding protein
VAVAFESYALYPNKTVYQNLEFPLLAPIRKSQYTTKEIDKIVRETAELLHIEELLDRLPSQLSGGQKQRVSLGRTLVRRPKVFLFDEPIAHLDAKLRHRMRGELKRLQKEMGISAIFATPDQLEAVSMADRVAILNKGVIQQIGTPEEIYFQPANLFVANMVGDPKINIFRGSVKKDGGVYYLCHKDFRLSMDKSAEKIVAGRDLSGDIDIGVRPTCFRLSNTKMGEGDIQTRVSFMQRMGDSQVVKLDVGSFTFTTKVDQSVLYSIGDTVWFSLSGDKIFFFDPVTGNALKS